MKKKHYHILKACLNGAVALFFISLPIWESRTRDPGFIMLTAIFGYWTVKNFKQIKESRDNQIYTDTEDSVPERIAFYKMYTSVSAIGFPILTIISIIDLNNLVSGTKERLRIFAPVGFVYEQFGYWPAVFTIPLIGIIFTSFCFIKIHNLRSNLQKGQKN